MARTMLPSKVTREMVDAIAAEDILAIADSDRCPWRYKLEALEHARDWLFEDPRALYMRVVVQRFEPGWFVVRRLHDGCSVVEGEVVFDISRSGRAAELGFPIDLSQATREGLVRVLQSQWIDVIAPFAEVAA